ncbi:MAG: AAA family ATPase [Actinomycetota bacterium]
MRPLDLVLEGFRSHEHRTQISFRNRSLIAIVGPTGAGKSSILDAICYALYGKTPREQGRPQKLICSRGEEARVKLTFAVDGRTYEVTRAVRRKGQAPHVLIDLDAGEHLCSGVAAVSTRVEELLGLDFAAFCSSVLLAQGEFAKFLGATAGKRSEILKGVFRLEQIDALRAAAKGKLDGLDGDLREIEGERRGIPEDVAALIARATGLHEAASERATRLEKALPREEELQSVLRDAHARSERATKELARYDSASRRLPEQASFAELREQESSIGALLTEGRAALEAAGKRRGAALNALGSLEVKHGSERALAELRAKADGLGRLAHEVDVLRERAKSTQEEVDGLRKAAESAEGAHSTARAALSRAEVKRAEIEVAHRAHALRSELEIGAPCPVCEQAVTALPTGAVVASVTEAQTAARAAKEAEDRSAAFVADARGALTRSEARLAGLAERVEGAVERLTAARSEVGAAVGETDDPLAAIDAWLAMLSAARAEVEDARKVLEESQSEVRRREALEDGFATARRAAAAQLIEVAAAVELDPPGIEDPVDALADGARRALEEVTERLKTARSALEEASRAEADTEASLSSLRAELQLAEGATIAQAMARARADADVAAKEVADLEAKAVRAAELDELEAKLRARRADFAQLYTDFGPRGFISFLLEEKTRLLMELGSERLRAMTDRYRLAVDGAEMNVVDELDGEKRRNVDTLSGGETFLASLALALALAELVTRSGGRLQCFFLDEGFGSLDPESFDLAMTGIENIVTEDRLIGLVSHVPALALRVEDRIELEKDGDGMSVVRMGERLG